MEKKEFYRFTSKNKWIELKAGDMSVKTQGSKNRLRSFINISFLVVLIIISVLPCFASAYSTGYIEVDESIFINGYKINPGRQLVAVSERILTPARSTFEALGVRTNWDSKSGQVNIKNGSSIIEMNIGSEIAKINGTVKSMGAPAMLINGNVMVPIRFVAEAFGAEVKWDGNRRAVLIGTGNKKTENSVAVSRSWERTPVVVIDPGHGGRLPGAVYGGIKEKDLNLDIAKRLNKLLKEQGVRTYMTRDDDSHISVYSRAEFANRVNADLFLSIHNNAGSANHSGSMTLYCPSAGRFTGRDFASTIQSEMVKTLGTRNNGLYSRPNLVVLRKTKMPAVIAEVAYMTNSSDMKNLKSEDFRQKAAEALKDGVITALETK